MKWIKVKDKPKEGDRVLVYAKGGRMLTAIFSPYTYSKKGFYCYDIDSEGLEVIQEPTHWMPLPEPPAE